MSLHQRILVLLLIVCAVCASLNTKTTRSALFNTVRTWTAQSTMASMARELELAAIHGDGLLIDPETSTDPTVTGRSPLRVNTDLDAWGNPYHLVRNDRQVFIVSNGPDGTQHTPDDLRVELTQLRGLAQRPTPETSTTSL
ncbi:MAG: hypothetical protein AAFS10_23545 [Myxococcota bacterium]